MDLHPKRRKNDRIFTAQASVVATLGPAHDKPWWWKHLSEDRDLCPLNYERLVFKGKYSQTISTRELPSVMFRVLSRLLRWRGTYDYVFTFECDLVGFSIAFWQAVTGMRRPKHVILQFIMREREDNIRSKAKYQLMRFLFSSVHRVVVSSTLEADYYRRAFRWSDDKVAYVPLHTAPELLAKQPVEDGDFYLAAGRTFRDYPTLLSAVRDTPFEVVIVGGSGTAATYGGTNNVRILEDIPVSELEELILASRAVVVPLQDRPISVGQSVVLQAMALGKPVIATRTSGTVDYIDHLQTGVLVAPGDPDDLRQALCLLENEELRVRLGQQAREKVRTTYLPSHYSMLVRQALTR